MADDIREDFYYEVEDLMADHLNGTPGPNGSIPCECGRAGKESYFEHLTTVITDGILASPMVARIRAEAWDEGYDFHRVSTLPITAPSAAVLTRSNPYGPTSSNSFPTGDPK